MQMPMNRVVNRIREHHPHHQTVLHRNRLEMLDEIQRMPCRERSPTLGKFPRNRDRMLFRDIVNKNPVPEYLVIVLPRPNRVTTPATAVRPPCVDRRGRITSYGVSGASCRRTDRSESAKCPDVHAPSRRR